MGDEQRVPPDELIAQARARFESATDFTVAVEEEFAIVDPESLDLTNRFEDLQAAARGTALEEHLVGELIASEVEVRTGRQETFADVPAAMAERRAQLRCARRADGAPARRHGHAPVGGLEEAAHHRHAALPPKRRAAALRRLAQQHLRAARARRGLRAGPGDRGRRGAPELPPRAAGALGELAVRRGSEHGPPFGAHADLHALLPALWRPRRVLRRGASTRAS